MEGRLTLTDERAAEIVDEVRAKGFTTFNCGGRTYMAKAFDMGCALAVGINLGQGRRRAVLAETFDPPGFLAALNALDQQVPTDA